MTEDIFSIKNNVFVITGGMGQLGQVYTNAVLSRGGKVAILDIFDYKNLHYKILLVITRNFGTEKFLFFKFPVKKLTFFFQF